MNSTQTTPPLQPTPVRHAKWPLVAALLNGIVFLLIISGYLLETGVSLGNITKLNCEKYDIQTYSCIGWIHQQGKDCLGWKIPTERMMDGCGFEAVNSITNSKSSAAMLDGWKTFINKKHGYAFRYSPKWRPAGQLDFDQVLIHASYDPEKSEIEDGLYKLEVFAEDNPCSIGSCHSPLSNSTTLTGQTLDGQPAEVHTRFYALDQDNGEYLYQNFIYVKHPDNQEKLISILPQFYASNQQYNEQALQAFLKSFTFIRTDGTMGSSITIPLACGTGQERATCMDPINAGYYYDVAQEACRPYNSIRSSSNGDNRGCASPPFSSLFECISSCLPPTETTEPSCEQITSAETCGDRKDCLSEYSCPSTTDQEFNQKCNQKSGGYRTCATTEFEYCHTLACPSSVNTNANTATGADGWVTFTDPDGQFSFRHPATLSVWTKENPRPAYPNMSVMHSLPEFGPWFPHVDLTIKKQPSGGFIVTGRSEGSANLDPEVFFVVASTDSQPAQADEYFIRFYQLASQSQDFEETVKQILASFVFLDPDANWKTYTNATHGYSVKYPTDWSVTEKFGQDNVRLLPPGVDGTAPAEVDMRGAVAVATNITNDVLEETLLAPINDLYGTHGVMTGIINYDVYLFSRNGKNISLWRAEEFADQRFGEIVHTFTFVQ